MKAALAKAQKQQQNNNCNNNSNVRQRAKSQSEKISMQQQQQQQQQQQLKSNGNLQNNSKQQQRIQKQQSLIVTSSNIQNYTVSSNNSNLQNNNNNVNSNKGCNNNNHSQNGNNNTNNILNVSNSFNNMTNGGYKTPTPPPLSGNDLLALAAAASASGASIKKSTNASVAATNTGQFKNISGNSGQQKPRPSSVSLHFPEASIMGESTNGNDQMPQLQRMASGTNLRILKRSTSYQPTQQNHSDPQLRPQRKTSSLPFTPSFNSWTNFTFTKNFIANVFC